MTTAFAVPRLDDNRPSLDSAARILAALLVGFGVIMAVAANWTAIGRMGRFGLVGGAIVAASALALLVPRFRAGALLGSFLGIGGLLALVGQTYQSGADPWQLFALWAALGLPLAYAARHDVVWSAFVLVVSTAIPLWLFADTGTLDRAPAGPTLAAWLCAGLLAAAVYPHAAARRVLGGTQWAWRLAFCLLLALVTALALLDLLTPRSGFTIYLVGGGGLAFAVWSVVRARAFDLALAAAAILALDTYLVAGIWRVIERAARTDSVPSFMAMGLAAAGVIAASVAGLLHLARRQGSTQRADTASSAWISDVAPASDRWPVVALSGLGALLAAGPFLMLYGTLFGSFIARGGGTYLVGVATLAGAVGLLRGGVAFSFRQLFGFITLLVGAGVLAYGVYRDLPIALASAVMVACSIGLAVATPIRWVVVLLGMAAAVFAGIGLTELSSRLALFDPRSLTLAAVVVGFAGAGALAIDPLRTARLTSPASQSAALAFVAGWTAAALLGLMFASGSTFLLGTTVFGGRRATFGVMAPGDIRIVVLQIASLGGAAAAILLLRRASATATTPLGNALAALAAILSLAIPTLGPTLAIGAVALVRSRQALALLAAFALIWILGSFYYTLDWTLLQKAGLLVTLGVLLGLVAMRFGETADAASFALPTAPVKGVGMNVAATAVALSLIGTAVLTLPTIVGNERLIRDGQRIYVALRPVDPRSLMQGDYMALRFDLGDEMRAGPRALLQQSVRALQAIATIDPRGVATVTDIAPLGDAAPPGTITLPLSRKNGHWILVSDAWFFPEGTGARFAAARYGELRVAPSGRALLVGLADANLAPVK